MQMGDIAVTRVAYANNLAYFFTKPLTTKVFEQHVDEMGVICNLDWN